MFLFYFSARFNQMKECPDNYFVTVLEDTETNQVIGTATLVKESKFIHDASAVTFHFSN